MVAVNVDGCQLAICPNIPNQCDCIDPILANTYYVATDIGRVSRTQECGQLVWSVLRALVFTGVLLVLGLTLHGLKPAHMEAGQLMAGVCGDIHVPDWLIW